MGAGESKHGAIALPEATLEQLRCSICNCHLSCGPIRLLPEGNSVCGRCSLPQHSKPIYRELAFELALSKATFPCRYVQYGCPQKLLFGYAIEHEARCACKPFPCPSLPFTTCSWEGSAQQVCYHFMEAHPALTTLFAEFNIDVDKDRQQILMVFKSFVAFVIKYRYDSNTSSLHYDIRYFASNALDATYKIRLVNNGNPDLNINLKVSKCWAYTPGIREMQVLTINKFLDVLDNPSTLKVEINISVKKFNQQEKKIRELVNFELLETLRCVDCHSYLSLPIFDSLKGIICSDCSKNHPDCAQSKNEELCKLITETNYPCRWRECKFIGKGYYIRMHELSCRFYPYDCPSPSCKSTLTVAHSKMMEFHLTMCHAYEFFLQRIAYKSVFMFSSERIFVTTKNNELLSIKHSVTDNKCSTHIFSLSTHKPGVDRVITAKVHFEHSHCKLKSRTFVLDNRSIVNVTANNLPKCFKIDERMTVVIEV